MMILVDFDSLVTFDCTYGDCVVKDGVVRVFVEKGLMLKRSKLIGEGELTQIVECEEDEFSKVESIFPVHYIYDPARDAEYVEWELVDGLLNARNKNGEWVEYKSKEESSYAMHEYVGGCWLVFLGVSFSRRVICKYSSDRTSPSGTEFVQEIGHRSVGRGMAKEYFLEGVIGVSLGPGWMSLEICAESFHIENSDR